MKHIQYSTYPLNHAITMKMQYALDRRMKNDTQDIGREKKETFTMTYPANVREL